MNHVKLSVNVNKVATLRNARGGRLPSVTAAVGTCVAAGASGITVHPRADGRHITFDDVREISRELSSRRALIERGRGVEGVEGVEPTERVELNIEGDPRPDLLALVHEVHADQCTLVPVEEREITSQAGWPPSTPVAALEATVRALRAAGIRASIFVDPDPEAVRWAALLGADRIELYTEPYARACHDNPEAAQASFQTYTAAAQLAHELGLGVNAGHDLDLTNLTLFRNLPHLAEVSIGHALVSDALFVGLDRAVRDYLAALAG